MLADAGNDAGMACGFSTAAPKSALPPIQLPANAIENANITIFKAGHTAHRYIPSVGWTIAAGVAVGADGTIFVSAGGTFKSVDGGAFRRISNEGFYYLTVGSDGNLYTDSVMYGGAIFRITPEGQTTMIASNLASTIGAMYNLVASPDGYIYLNVGQPSGPALIRVSLQGAVETVSQKWTGPLSFDDAGVLHVLAGNAIYRMVDAGAFEQVVCFQYAADSQPSAQSLLVEPNGDFLLSESGRFTLGQSETPGDPLALIPTRIFKVERATGNLTTYANGLYGPRGMARAKDGALLVTEFVSGGLRRIAPDGGTTAVVAGNLLSGPNDIALAADGTPVIGNSETGLLVKAVASPDFQTVTVSPYLMGFNLYTGVPGVFDFVSLKFDPDGNLFVAEYAPDINRTGVSKVTPTNAVSWFTTVADSPGGLAVDDERYLWVTNSRSRRIERYDTGGTRVGYLTHQGLPGEAVWRDGGLFVIDSDASTIVRVAKDFDASIWAGPFPEQKESMLDLAFAPNGNAVVSAGGTLYLVSDGGRTIEYFASGLGPDGSTSFQGVEFARDAGLYVNCANGSVLRITGPFQ